MAGDKIICHCKQVSYIDIRKAMIAGARTVQEIKDMTGAATGCGRCVGEIENILASVCGCKGVSLEDVVKAAKWLLKTGGHFYMVHRPFRLAEIIYTLKQHKLEPKRMRLVHPYVDKEPNMVLIDAAKGGKQRITVEPPLIVYNKDGSYTDEIYQIYGEMKN